MSYLKEKILDSSHEIDFISEALQETFKLKPFKGVGDFIINQTKYSEALIKLRNYPDMHVNADSRGNKEIALKGAGLIFNFLKYSYDTDTDQVLSLIIIKSPYHKISKSCIYPGIKKAKVLELLKNSMLVYERSDEDMWKGPNEIMMNFFYDKRKRIELFIIL